MSDIEDYKARIIGRSDLGPRPGDGEQVYWTGQGSCMSADDLRIIADELDARNSRAETTP